MTGEAELLEVVAALKPCRRLAHLLHGGQEQTDQNGDDGNHHQKLDEGKGGAQSRTHGEPPGGGNAEGPAAGRKGRGGQQGKRCANRVQTGKDQGKWIISPDFGGRQCEWLRKRWASLARLSPPTTRAARFCERPLGKFKARLEQFLDWGGALVHNADGPAVGVWFCLVYSMPRTLQTVARKSSAVVGVPTTLAPSLSVLPITC